MATMMRQQQEEEFQSKHWQSVTAMWRQGMLCDVQLRASTGELLTAHSIVLASASGFFRYAACLCSQRGPNHTPHRS